SCLIMSSEVLNILNIPQDIIRTIVRVGQEDIDSMLLISQQWNSLALEHLSNRTHLPVINKINLIAPDSNYTLEMTIPINRNQQGIRRT
ncbi:hypothetical protein PMAYCL1PPCAC_05888, partial [Pristionchus mayeri]